MLWKILARDIQQRLGQVTIQPCFINNSRIDLDEMLDNDSVKFSITVDGRDFEVEMESVGDGQPTLECEFCKRPFISSDDRLQHEKAQHPDEKRADLTIIFNPMLFHALQRADN